MRFKIDWANLVVGSKFSVFALFYFVFEGNFLSTSPWGAYIWRGLYMEVGRGGFQKIFFPPFGPHFGRKVRSGPYPGSGTIYY